MSECLFCLEKIGDNFIIFTFDNQSKCKCMLGKKLHIKCLNTWVETKYNILKCPICLNDILKEDCIIHSGNDNYYIYNSSSNINDIENNITETLLSNNVLIDNNIERIHPIKKFCNNHWYIICLIIHPIIVITLLTCFTIKYNI